MASWLAQHLPPRVTAAAWFLLMLGFATILAVVAMELVLAPTLAKTGIAVFFAVAFGPAMWCEWHNARRMALMLRTGE